MTRAACLPCAVVPLILPCNLSSPWFCPWAHAYAPMHPSVFPRACLQGFADYGLEEPSVEGMDVAPVPRIDWSAKTKEEIVRGMGLEAVRAGHGRPASACSMRFTRAGLRCKPVI